MFVVAEAASGLNKKVEQVAGRYTEYSSFKYDALKAGQAVLQALFRPRSNHEAHVATSQRSCSSPCTPRHQKSITWR